MRQILFCFVCRAFQEQEALWAFPGPPALRYRPQTPKSWHFPCPNRLVRYLSRYSPNSVPTPYNTCNTQPALSCSGAEAARHPLLPPIAALALRYRISNSDPSLGSNWCLQAPRTPLTGWSHPGGVKPVTHPKHKSHDSHQIRNPIWRARQLSIAKSWLST